MRGKHEEFLLYAHKCVDLYMDIRMEKQFSSTILLENNLVNLGLTHYWTLNMSCIYIVTIIKSVNILLILYNM